MPSYVFIFKGIKYSNTINRIDRYAIVKISIVGAARTCKAHVSKANEVRKQNEFFHNKELKKLNTIID